VDFGFLGTGAPEFSFQRSDHFLGGVERPGNVSTPHLVEGFIGARVDGAARGCVFVFARRLLRGDGNDAIGSFHFEFRPFLKPARRKAARETTTGALFLKATVIIVTNLFVV
jgi:hypothetical protein